MNSIRRFAVSAVVACCCGLVLASGCGTVGQLLLVDVLQQAGDAPANAATDATDNGSTNGDTPAVDAGGPGAQENGNDLFIRL